MLIGLVGKANTGKSTFFKAITLADVAIAPYPFTTLDKNEGVGFVETECPETEFRKKCKPNHGYCVDGKRFVPVKMIDVAGLVPGAHKGKGRGNQFLDDLRQADVLIHVLDLSGRTDAEGKATENYDPCNDVRFLQDELDMWMHSIITSDWTVMSRKIQMSGLKISEELAKKLSGLKISEEMIKKAIKKIGLSEKIAEWSSEDLMEFVKILRELSKPIIIAANKADTPQADKNLEKLKEEFPELLIIKCSAECELALREASRDKLIEYVSGSSDFEILSSSLTEQQKKGLSFISSYLSKNKDTGVQKCLNEAVFNFLKHIVVYPVESESHISDSAGNVLPDAFLVPQGSTALDLAYAVHTHIGNNFIAAIDARSRKRLAKDYVLQDKDIIRIVTK
ncbi:redox-regulated ATPase YchF [Candidatus Pacearchaeota archaeon]|nr:redox-regulated ATPase YchF [Candidatus Pacearchaeota archaeon]